MPSCLTYCTERRGRTRHPLRHESISKQLEPLLNLALDEVRSYQTDAVTVLEIPVIAPLPKNESARLHALKQYEILDTEPEQSFDDLRDADCVDQFCRFPAAVVEGKGRSERLRDAAGDRVLRPCHFTACDL